MKLSVDEKSDFLNDSFVCTYSSGLTGFQIRVIEFRKISDVQNYCERNGCDITMSFSHNVEQPHVKITRAI